MDLAYLRECDGDLYYMKGNLDLTANAFKVTKQRALSIRSAICTSPLDRGVRRHLYRN